MAKISKMRRTERTDVALDRKYDGKARDLARKGARKGREYLTAYVQSELERRQEGVR